MAAGSIVWEMLMKTATFETDTKRAEKRLKELQKEAVAAGKVLGAAIAAGAAAATYALKQSIDAIDQVGDAAVKLGTTTEAFSALAYAARQEGIAMADLETALGKLGKAAADGNDAFAAMGISVKDAGGNLKTADVLFADVAEKFASYRDGAEKSALSMELFGRTGAKLITTLNMGRDGLAAMGSEAAAFGQIVGQDAASAAGEFNDNMFKLQTAMTGVFNVMAADLLPSLVSLTGEMVDTTKGSSALETAGRTLASGFRLVGSAVFVVGGIFQTVGRLIGNIAGFIVTQTTRAVDVAAGHISGIGEALKLAATGNFSDAGKAIAGVGKLYSDAIGNTLSDIRGIGGDVADDVAGTVAKINAIWAKGATDAEAAADRPGGGLAAPVVAASKAAKTAADAATKALEAERKRLEAEGQRLVEAMMSPFERMQATTANVEGLAAAGVIDPTTQARALSAAKQQYDDFIAAQQAALTTGLLNEEQQIRASYERRREEILALSEVTETQRADALAALEEKRDADLAAAKLDRYRDLLDEQERLTIEYTNRRREIEDDESLTREERIQYLGALQQDWSAKMTSIDEADAAKRKELQQNQIDMVSSGFAGMADLAKAFAGEQSGTYQALFAASKAFAIADMTIKQSQAIAKAWGENNYFVAAGLTVGLAAQFAGLIGSANSASFGGTRADGGSVNAGRNYLVGERGPEMFAPSQPGTIIPNDMLQQQQTSQPIRIVNAYDSAHVADFMGSDAGERVIMNAVRRNKRALGMA